MCPCVSMCIMVHLRGPPVKLANHVDGNSESLAKKSGSVERSAHLGKLDDRVATTRVGSVLSCLDLKPAFRAWLRPRPSSARFRHET